MNGLVEEIAHQLYAGGPYGEFICFLDDGARAITDAHSMDVYRRIAADVLRAAHAPGASPFDMPALDPRPQA